MSEHFSSRVDTARRLAELRQGPAEPAPAEIEDGLEFDAEEETAAFSIVSADRQQKVALEFRLLGGNAKAIAYSYLVALDFDPSEGIKLDFSGYAVEIRGRNLHRLWDALVTQRCAVVREMDELRAEAELGPTAPIVTKIVITAVD